MRKYFGLYLPLIRVVRIIVMVFVAMVFDEKEYAVRQVMFFLFLSFIKCLYLGCHKTFVA